MRLDDIKARVAAATAGPWYSEPAGRILPARVGVEGHRRGVGDYAFAFLDDSVRPEQGGAEWDGPFIAHARTDIPDLLAVVEAARALAGKLWCVNSVQGPCSEHGAAFSDPDPDANCDTVRALTTALAPLLADE